MVSRDLTALAVRLSGKDKISDVNGTWAKGTRSTGFENHDLTNFMSKNRVVLSIRSKKKKTRVLLSVASFIKPFKLLLPV